MKITLYSLVISLLLITGCTDTSFVKSEHMDFNEKRLSKKMQKIKDSFLLNTNFFYPKYTKKNIRYFGATGGVMKKDGSISTTFLLPIEKEYLEQYKKKHPYSIHKVSYDKGVAKELSYAYGMVHGILFFDDKQRTIVNKYKYDDSVYKIRFIVYKKYGRELLDCDIAEKICEYKIIENNSNKVMR